MAGSDHDSDGLAIKFSGAEGSEESDTVDNGIEVLSGNEWVSGCRAIS